MPYANSNAVNRNDIMAHVQHAPDVERLLVADEIFPYQGTPETDFRYPVFGIDDTQALKAEDPNAQQLLIQAGSGYPRVKEGFKYEEDSCIKQGIEYPIDDVDKRQKNGKFGLDLEIWAAARSIRTIRLSRERRCAALLTSSGNGINRTNANVTWSVTNKATSRVVEDLLDAIGRLVDKGYEPNAIIIPYAKLQAIKFSAQFLEYGKNFGVVTASGAASTSSITNSDIVACFAEHGIDRMIVTRGKVQTNGGGTGTPTLTSLWSEDFAMVASIQSGPLEDGGVGRTMFWTEDDAVPYQTQTYRDEPKECDIIRCKHFDRERIIDPNAAEYIKTTA